MTGPNHYSLESLVNEFYRDWWRLCPSAGSRDGLRDYDSDLEAAGTEWIEEYRSLLARTNSRLEFLRVPPAGTDAGLDHRLFQSHLRMSQLRIDELAHWRQDPSGPLTDAVEAIFELLMRRNIRNEDTARSVVSRLEKLPASLRSARERIDDPVRLWSGIAIETAPGGVEFIREAARELSELHPKVAPAIESAAAGACLSLHEYARWVESLESRKLKEDVAAGPGVLARLVRDWHGLDSTLEEIEALGRSMVEYFATELKQHARRLDAKATWQEIMDRSRKRFAAEFAGESNGTGRMLDAYRRITDDLRARIEIEKLLELPAGETCKVISSPAFLRALLPTAAYSNPGALDPNQIGVFFVSDPDPRRDGNAFEANVAQHYGIEETCVHEAYPGHHVQLCWANRAGSLTRQMADHVIFMEGWTLYCEQWMIEAGWFPDPALKINYLAGQLWRAYRMIIDVGIHTRKMTVPQAVATLVEGLGFTLERAQTELNWYSQSPGVPLSYMMGKRETLNLREQYFRRRGRDLLGFHTWLMQFGSVPQPWLRAHLPPADTLHST